MKVLGISLIITSVTIITSMILTIGLQSFGWLNVCVVSGILFIINLISIIIVGVRN